MTVQEHKRNKSEGSTLIQDQKKKDLSKVKCFNCHKLGHFAIQCPQKKRKGRRNCEKKKNTRRGSTPKQNKKDLSKIKCYKHHTIGHFVYQCPQNKTR